MLSTNDVHKWSPRWIYSTIYINDKGTTLFKYLAQFQAYNSGKLQQAPNSKTLVSGACTTMILFWWRHFFRQQGGPIFSPRLQTLLFKVFSSVSLVLEVGSKAWRTFQAKVGLLCHIILANKLKFANSFITSREAAWSCRGVGREKRICHFCFFWTL